MTRRVNLDGISFIVSGPGLRGIAFQCLAGAAWGQAISGVVKDTSGAVLAGVTVEAASPALIEKSRSTVTNSS